MNTKPTVAISGLLLCVALVWSPARAETLYQLGGALNGDIGESLGWSAGADLRLDSSGQRVASMPWAELSWRFNDWLNLGAGYRYMNRRDNAGVLQDRDRAYLNATLGWAPGEKWRLRYRLRWQEEWRDAADDGTPQRQYLRHRLLARYRLNGQLAPYGSVEFFNRLDQGGAGSSRKTRYAAGLVVDVGKRRELDLYLQHTERQGTDPSSQLIGARFEYTLKN